MNEYLLVGFADEMEKLAGWGTSLLQGVKKMIPGARGRAGLAAKEAKLGLGHSQRMASQNAAISNLGKQHMRQSNFINKANALERVRQASAAPFGAPGYKASQNARFAQKAQATPVPSALSEWRASQGL